MARAPVAAISVPVAIEANELDASSITLSLVEPETQ
jgi:hypothetical protein